MVNTFITSSDYKISAKNLDNKRLGKQRVEAYQILNLIQDLSLLSRLFNFPMPLNPYLRREWIRQLVKKYKDTNCYLFYHQNTWVWISRNTKPYILKNNENAIIQNDGSIIVYKTSKYKSINNNSNILYPKYGVVTRDDRLITLGFIYHPVILMWLGHDESLKEYINACIDEWISRGNSNNMKKCIINPLNVSENIKPIWVNDLEIHINHKASLYIKEIKRNEYPWYANKFDFVESGKYYLSLPIKSKKSKSDFDHYIWPYNTNDNRYKF